MSKGTDIGNILLQSLTDAQNRVASLESNNITGTELLDEEFETQSAFYEESAGGFAETVAVADAIDAYAAGTAVADTLDALASQAEAAVGSPAAAVALESLHLSMQALMKSHRLHFDAPSMEAGQTADEALLASARSRRMMSAKLRTGLVASMEAATQNDMDIYFNREDKAVEAATRIKRAVSVVNANKAQVEKDGITIDHKRILQWLSVDNKPVKDIPSAIAAEIQNIHKLANGVTTCFKSIDPIIQQTGGAMSVYQPTIKALETMLAFDPATVFRSLENLRFLYNSKLVTDEIRGSRGEKLIVLRDRWDGHTTDGSKASVGARAKVAFKSAAIGLGGAAVMTAGGVPIAGLLLIGGMAAQAVGKIKDLNTKAAGSKTVSTITPDSFAKALDDLQKLIPMIVGTGKQIKRARSGLDAVPNHISSMISVIREHDDKVTQKQILDLVNKHIKDGRIDNLTEAKNYLVDRWYYSCGLVVNLGGFLGVQVYDDVMSGALVADKMVSAITGKKDDDK